MRTTVAAVLCVTIFGSPPAAVAAPATIAIDKYSSIAGPIFRTQPASKPEPRQFETPTSIVETDCDTTNLPQQLQQSTQLPDDVNLIPQQKIQPSCTNETATADTASYTQYNDEDGEDDKDIENDYILFFCWIPIIFLLMLVLLVYSNLRSFCISRMKKDSGETLCLQSSSSRYNVIQ
ncbi:uncharacterized protein LOC113552419 [Rhopalosiphum maidis]|uniref:uncharacterized protein LOC113552419 n=1 Tax=Rhopalosiphum maidis TaxID=43146 RepID=UPI000EFF4B77|nr:uncharacterized protein LOC113552419 [Rhopalosiphum maidis]